MKASKEEALKLLEDMAVVNGHSLQYRLDPADENGLMCGCANCGSAVYFAEDGYTSTLLGLASLSKCTREGQKKDWSQARENELLDHLRANYKGDFHG